MSGVVVILGFAAGLILLVLRSLVVDEVNGHIQRRITASLEATIAGLTPELEAEWADEWRAELAEAISMPFTAALLVRGLRRSARELSDDLFLVPSPQLTGNQRRSVHRVLLDYRARRRSGLSDAAAGAADAALGTVAADQLEAWRIHLRQAILRTRVRDNAQFDRFIGTPSVTGWATADDRSTKDDGIEIGRAVASDLAREWDAAQGPLLILGDPGYGKTLAALRLVANINASAASGAAVAEVFPLVDWCSRATDHAEVPLADWLAEHLSASYLCPKAVSRQLIADGFVIPILDGFDDVPASTRRTCVDAIASYAASAPTPRSFALTSRPSAYDDHLLRLGIGRLILLTGLDSCQIDRILSDHSPSAGWEAIRALHAAGDSELRRLLRSPMQMGRVLQAFAQGDPRELIGLRAGEAAELVAGRLASQIGPALPASRRPACSGWATALRAVGGSFRRSK